MINKVTVNELIIYLQLVGPVPTALASSCEEAFHEAIRNELKAKFTIVPVKNKLIKIPCAKIYALVSGSEMDLSQGWCSFAF